MNSAHRRSQTIVSSGRLRGLAGILALLAVSIPAQAACTASPALEARLKASPSSDSYAAVGNWFAEHKQFNCAAASFSSAFKLKPTAAPLAYLWGLSLSSAGHDEQAAAPLHQAIQLEPTDIRPHLLLASVLVRMKKNAEAEWRAALAIDPDSEQALDGLAQELLAQKDYTAVIALLDKPGSTRVRTPQQSLNLGTAYAGTAQLDAATKVLREGLNNDPDSLPIANQLALVLMLHGREQEAFAVLDLALEKHPGDQATQLLYLRTQVSSHSEKATDLAHKLLAASPDQWEVLYLNAVLEAQEADFQNARAHLERSITLHPDYADSHAALGNILAKQNDLPAAKAHLEKAIALGDNNFEIAYDLSKVLQRMGDKEGAQQKLQIYQQLKKAHTDRVQAAGKAEEADQASAAGNPAQAASLYRVAIESDPNEPILYYKLSRALDKLKDIAGEVAALQKAIQLKPNYAEAQNQLGYLAARKGDLAQAESYFRAAIHASASYVSAWINLSATLASEAKMPEAKEAVGRALEIDPDNAEARSLSQALANANSTQ
jgi:tetratricopeptide (TPR) repeat protein